MSALFPQNTLYGARTARRRRWRVLIPLIAFAGALSSCAYTDGYYPTYGGYYSPYSGSYYTPRSGGYYSPYYGNRYYGGHNRRGHHY